MHISHHAGQRMNRRGISRRILDFTLRHGRIEGDKHIIDRHESRRIIERLNEELRVAKQILDKGGVTVVDEGDTIITAYNVNVPLSARALARGCRSAREMRPATRSFLHPCRSEFIPTVPSESIEGSRHG